MDCATFSSHGFSHCLALSATKCPWSRIELSEGIQLMVAEEEMRGEECRGESELKRGRTLITRVTHSIEGWSQTICRGNWKTTPTEFHSNIGTQFRWQRLSQKIWLVVWVCVFLDLTGCNAQKGNATCSTKSLSQGCHRQVLLPEKSRATRNKHF